MSISCLSCFPFLKQKWVSHISLFSITMNRSYLYLHMYLGADHFLLHLVLHLWSLFLCEKMDIFSFTLSLFSFFLPFSFYKKDKWNIFLSTCLSLRKWAFCPVFFLFAACESLVPIPLPFFEKRRISPFVPCAKYFSAFSSFSAYKSLFPFSVKRQVHPPSPFLSLSLCSQSGNEDRLTLRSDPS